MIKRFRSMYLNIDRPIPNIIVSFFIIAIELVSLFGIIIFGLNSLAFSIYLFGIIFHLLYSIKFKPIFLFLRYEPLYKSVCKSLCSKGKLLTATIDFGTMYDECKCVLEASCNTGIDVVYRESTVKEGFKKYSKRFKSKVPRHIKDEFEIGLYTALLDLDVDCDTSSDIAFFARGMCSTILFTNTILEFSDRSRDRINFLLDESDRKIKSTDYTSIASLVKANKELDAILTEIKEIRRQLGIGDFDDEQQV